MDKSTDGRERGYKECGGRAGDRGQIASARRREGRREKDEGVWCCVRRRRSGTPPHTVQHRKTRF